MTIWDKLQKMDRRILYIILIVVCSLGLLSGVGKLPVFVDQQAIDLYTTLQTVPVDKPVLIQSDWTSSTRGENLGHLEALLRIVMARKIKFAIYSVGDAQAVQVARNVIMRINEERTKGGLKPYAKGEDYVEVGLFPQPEAIGNDMGNDIRKAWGDKRTTTPSGAEVPIFETPVLKNVKKVGDASLMVVITASDTIDKAVQRLSKKVTMACMCTGVIGPSVLPYYQAGQVKGFASGLKAVYEMEFMMANGVNIESLDTDGHKVTLVESSKPGIVPKVSEGVTFARGDKYYATFHGAMALLIGAVILGNIGMFASRRAARRNA